MTSDDVRARAVRLIPPAAIGVAPQGTTLVNIETVLWVDAPARRTLPTVTILGQQVAITIRLARVDWDFGDGEHASTSTAGKRYDDRLDPCHDRMCADYYGHVYEHTGSMTIAATASWTASFTIDGGQPITIPGTVTGPRATAAITVKEARGVLVPNPGDH